jgi:ferredoxin-NADP reductase
MATAAATRVDWRVATVKEIVQETGSTRTVVLDVPDWPGHLAGQHVDVRLTAEDGYQAQRSYSVASAPEASAVSLTVERLEDGEVSSYLCGELRIGDRFELRGPIGGYFVWDARLDGPLFLVAGGSGIVPLMAMLRHREARRASTRSVLARLLYSSRRWEDIIYREQLERMRAEDRMLEVFHTITREPPHDGRSFGRRVDREMLGEVGFPPEHEPRIYVCGPTPFVEAVANNLVALGHDATRVKTERFGPTGTSA